MIAQTKHKGFTVVGFGGSSHDFSSAISVNNDIKFAIEDERLSRRKHGEAWWYQNPIAESLNYCLAATELHFDDIDKFVTSNLIPARVVSQLPSNKLKLYPHHLCHAASGILLTSTDLRRTGIIIYDGMGSNLGEDDGISTRETVSFFLNDEGSLKTLGETTGLSHNEDIDFPMGCTNSVGHFYELVTLLIGFSPYQEGKTMGLSSYGQPRFLPLLLEHVCLNNDLNSCFVANPIESGLIESIESELKHEGYSFNVKADFAASVQALIEHTLLHFWNLIKSFKLDSLIIAGGCGLNSVANGLLAKKLPIEVPIVIPPFTGDSGLGLGAIKLFSDEQNDNHRHLTFRGEPISARIARLGKVYETHEIDRAINRVYPKIAVDRSVKGAIDVAKRIAIGEIVAIFHGSSEIGPRALGGRSILANPRNIAVRENLNRIIKRREPFRPFAPIVLHDYFDEFFLCSKQADPYMIKVANVRQESIWKIPAVVHVDGTARVQVTDSNLDPFMSEILLELNRLIGVPIVLNTSFNRCGEPIVETPFDAIDCFLGLEINGLWLQDRYLVNSAQYMPMNDSDSSKA